MSTQHQRATGVEPPTEGTVAFGHFRVEIGRRRLWRDAELISLSPKAFELLIGLLSEPGTLVTKDALLRRLWPDTFVSEESLTQCVSALRRALGDDSTHPQFIATVPRRGYRFVHAVDITPAPPLDSDSSPAPRPAADAPAISPRIGPLTFPQRALTPSPRPALNSRTVMAIALAVAVALATAGAVVISRRTTAAGIAAPLSFLEHVPPGTLLASGGVISPDGRTLAFLAKQNETRTVNLWVRPLNGTAARMLSGTSGATRPFWSPDARALGFFAEGKLKTIQLESGAIQTLATVGPMPVGGSWSTRGVILFADRRSPLMAIDASGGTIRQATTLDASAPESAHRYPYFLPDGDHFLYYANSANVEHAGTFLASLSGGRPRRVLDGASNGTVYAGPGFLLHVSEGRLVAHRFDFASAAVKDAPIVLATGVDRPEIVNEAVISVSATGLLTYGGGSAPTRLVWFAADGRRLSAVDSPTQLHNPAITSDDRNLLGSSIEPERRGTWLVDTVRGTPSWLVHEATSPSPSPDAAQIAFSSNRRSGVLDIYSRPLGQTSDTLLLASPEPKTVTQWTRDGRYLIFTSSNARTKEDVWLLPLFGERRPQPLLQTAYNEMQGEVSPDGQWLAYSSDESGRWEVYVQKFPEGGWKRTISIAGGVEPHWRASGRLLYFLSPDQHITRVEVGDNAHIGRPEPMFQVPLSSDLPTIYRNQYAVSPDGSRFVVDAIDGPVSPITVLVNWQTLADGR